MKLNESKIKHPPTMCSIMNLNLSKDWHLVVIFVNNIFLALLNKIIKLSYYVYFTICIRLILYFELIF